MPRFFFNIYDGSGMPDEEGVELSDQDTAREEAIRLAGAVIADKVYSVRIDEKWLLEVTDDFGRVLFRLDFSISGAAVGEP